MLDCQLVNSCQLIVGGAPREVDGGYRALKPFSDVVGVVVNCQCLDKGQSLIEHTAFKGLFIVTANPNFLMSGKAFNKPQSG